MPVDGRGSGRLVVLGEFGRAHGVRGEVRLKSFTAEPRAIAVYGPLLGPDGRRFTLLAVRPAGASPDMLVARVEGVTSREAAEALNRVPLSVDREALGAAGDDDEFFHADLIGLAALDAAGEPVGRVVAVPDHGGGAMLEIAPARGGASVLVPFTRACVPTVDVGAGRIVVAPPVETEAAPE